MKKKIVLFINHIKLTLHLLIFRFNRERDLLNADMDRWAKILLKTDLQSEKKSERKKTFIYLMTYQKAFRNLFYFRMQLKKNPILYIICRILFPPLSDLFIITKKIGPGFFIQHGWSTALGAKSVGKNFWLNQHVQIGHTRKGSPTIGDNVMIFAGAKAFGDIRINDNVKIGANAVVVKNVPANSTVVGVPSFIVKKNGVRVNEKL